jgi:teichoic acid transport system permease protein
MTIPVPATELIELGYVPTMRAYLRDIWSRREFAVIVPYNDLRAQKLNTALGQLWHILNPAVNVFVYWIIFGLILKVNRGIDNYVGFLTVGIVLYSTTTRLASSSVNAMERDAGLIRTVQFPRAIIPISSTVEQAMAVIPAMGVLMITMLLTGESASFRWLLLPVVLFFHTLINLGIALVLARAGFGVRDLSQVIQHIFRLMFYASGVLFLPTRFVEDPQLVRLFAINPIYDVLTFGRWVFMDFPITSDELFGMVVWAFGLPVIGMIWFVRAEHRYGG